MKHWLTFSYEPFQMIQFDLVNWFDRFTNGAFPLHGSARLGTVRLSSGRFAFPLQFSTAIEWAGLFTRRYNCYQALAGSAPRLSTRGTSVLPQQTMKQIICGWCKKVRLLKQKLRPLLRWLCWFKSSGSMGLMSQVQWRSNDDSLRPISDQQSLHVTFW